MSQSTAFAWLPNIFKISALDQRCYLTRYGGWINQGNVTKVILCEFDFPNTGHITAYAKAVNLDELADRIMCLNEITGWLLAYACGLPVPEKAFLAKIPMEALPSGLSSGNWVFFCTQQISTSQACGLIPTEELCNEQFRWKYLHDTIALDEWTGNADRHLNNLVRKSAKEFYLIDHGRLAFQDKEPCWDTETLPFLHNQSFANLLHHNTYIYLDISSPKAIDKGVRFCSNSCKQHAIAVGRVLHEIAFWCSQLVPGCSSNWINFLYKRLLRSTDLIQRRFGVLPMDAQ